MRFSFNILLRSEPPSAVALVPLVCGALLLSSSLCLMAADAVPPVADAVAAGQQSARIAIKQYLVEGNSLLTQDQISQIVSPYTGENRGYADIQRALEALESVYKERGYSTVQIYVPEQEIENGVVHLRVVEALLGKVLITGALHHDEDNIRASLASLKPGVSPNARGISENIQLANQNPAKITDVVLSMSDKEGEVDAKVTVADDNPRKFLISLDNTGNASTGRWRAGVGYRHANLFNRDHELTFNYTTSPDHMGAVKQYAMSYRLPLYQWGDSIDFIAAKSDTSTGSTPTVAGPLTFSGSGNVYGLHFNHNFARKGEYSSHLTVGADWRAFNNTCALGAFGPAGCGSAAADVTVHPLSLTYVGDLTSPGQQVGFSVSYLHNVVGGKNGDDADFVASRPNVAIGVGGADAGYQMIRLGAEWLKVLSNRWQLHLAFSGQFTRDALVSGEQFGLAGASSVRGFQEREVSKDRGFVANAELYSPELGSYFGFKEASLRGLFFIDHARGEQVTMRGETDRERVSLASVGAGLRYGFGRDISARFDVANIIDEAGKQQDGDFRGHFALNVAF